MTRYELLERIGVGGMAEIFRGTAVAAGGFEKPVAIKRILPHLSQDERFVKLLIGEAQILSLLRHRTVVQIFDVGLGPDGHYFLVMEYVDGADLGAVYERLEEKRKRLPVDLALHICAEVCEALDSAHQAKGPEGEPLRIVHRDVSPANVLLSRSGEVKLTDFGIAKRAEEVTGHGGVRGKFAYISPEQAINAKVDARSDIFSLGIVLYELLLGHRLFSGLPDFDALRAVRECRIPRPREIDPELAPELERILLTALASDPDDRFATARDFGTQMRSFRYSLSSSGGDPAKEIARIVDRFAPEPDDMVEKEPTVVRIKTAAGFTITGFDPAAAGGGVPEDDFGSDQLDEARRAFDDYDEEELSASALEPQAPEVLPEEDLQASDLFDDSLADAETRLVDTRREPATLPGPGDDERAATERVTTSSLERAATPTIRDVFSSGEILSGGPATPASVERWQPSTEHQQALRRARRRSLVMMSLASIAVAVISFFVAAGIVGSGEALEAPAADAGPATLDAGEEEDVVMPPDELEPAKPEKPTKTKAKPKTKRTRRRR